MARAPWILGATLLGIGGLLAFDQVRFHDPFALGSASAGLKLKPGAKALKNPIGATETAQGQAQTQADTQAQSGSTGGAQAGGATTTQQQAAPAKATKRRAVGASVSNPYGNVQVRVTARGGKIVGITFLDLPYGDPTSQSISDQVAPMLAQQAIDAQSANVAGVSGATYTSAAYRQSLQSALDQLGIK